MPSVEKQLQIQDTKLMAVLESLPRHELKRLQQFVSSPYFNADNKPVKLLTELTPSLLHGEPCPNKAVLYTTLYKGKYDDVKNASRYIGLTQTHRGLPRL